MSFLNPLFMIGAVAAAVPVLLHLIKREHARKIEFPSLMFLRRISQKTIRYRKLRHWMLLLLRILAFMLLVLSFMRPYREGNPAAASELKGARAHIIVLDNSMSMNYRDRWDRARKAAADIARESGADDRFAVLEFSDRTRARMQSLVGSSEALNLIQNGSELSDRPTRYAQALRTAEKFALESGMSKRIIHLISDFQKNGWAADEQDFRLSAGIELRPVDVGSKDFSNLVIRDVYIFEEESPVAAGLRIKASVANLGNQDRRDVRVSLFVDARMSADKKVDVAAGGSQGIEFRLPDLAAGLHAMMLEVEDAYLTRDNRFCMTVEARGKTPVQVVENPDSRRRRPSSFFLAKALNIDALSFYKLTAVSANDRVLSGGLLIWNDVPGGSAADQKKLRDFVEAGGGLIVVLGDSAQPGDFNRSFGTWLPVQMTEAVSAVNRTGNRPGEAFVLMTDIRTDHPIFRPFSKPHSGTFSNARFYGHARISVDSGSEVLARFDNGDPALVSINVGKGRILLFASSADDASNDLPLKAVYAPFWQQMLRYLENFQERQRWLYVGDVLDSQNLLAETARRQSKKYPDSGEAIVILDPGKRRLVLRPGSNSALMEQAGFYELQTAYLGAPVAVNPVPRESDLAHGNAEEMTAGWISSKPAAFSQDESLMPTVRGRYQRSWIFLLAAAVLFLIAESFFSNYELRMTNSNQRVLIRNSWGAL